MLRKSVFSGSFYPSDKRELASFVEKAVSSADVAKEDAKGAKAFVAPHAGYMYSGMTAGYAYKALSLSNLGKSVDAVVIIGPNHTGFGAPFAVSMEDWETPLGIIKNDFQLSEAIVGASQHVIADEEAHAEEHSIEVQLPFIQKLFPNAKACMVCMGYQTLEASQELASAILQASKSTKRRVALIASSDFDHYEPAEVAKRKDDVLLRHISKMEAEEFTASVTDLDDSACGYGPTTTAMLFASASGAKSGKVLNYSNSGDVTGDYSSVVAYASVMFK